MIIIGEKLNSSIPSTLKALQNAEKEYIIELITLQTKNGADFLDVNTSVCGETEFEKLEWVISLIQKHSCCGIMVDSPNTEVVKKIIPLINDREIIINSVTADQRIDELLSVITEFKTGVVALPLTKAGVPDTVEKRVENAKLVIDKLVSAGVPQDKIYLDVLAETLSVSDNSALIALHTIKEVKNLYPKVKTICGLSNISFGLPKRIVLNSAFLSMAIAYGLDSAIMDINSSSMKLSLAASLALNGNDEYCMEFITKVRELEE